MYCSYQAVTQGRYKESNLWISQKTTQWLLRLLKRQLISIGRSSTSFPEDEVTRIAYHFINAEGENGVEVVDSMDQRKEILKGVEEVLIVIQSNELRPTTTFYDRFMIHLNYFLDYLDRSRDDNLSLLDMETDPKDSYPLSLRDWFQDLLIIS